MSFDDLLLELKGQKQAQEDPNNISLDQLFNEGFMSKYSRCASFDELMEKGSFQAKTHEDIANIPEELLERHIARETEFPNWKAMLETAKQEHGGAIQG